MLIDTWMEKSGVSFGTSGARGLVLAMTDEVCCAYVLGFLKYLLKKGEFKQGGRVALAGDLRPSTPRILRACVAAIESAGGVPVFCGYVPTPALCLYAFSEAIPSLMVTGSHIPADRNGIKFNRAHGEFLKNDEKAMRQEDVAVPKDWFDEQGMLCAAPVLPEKIDVLSRYIQRYRHFFGENSLAGMKIGIYQHSAVGRDVLVDIVEALGGVAIPLARSETFVPVDTEAVRSEDHALALRWAQEYRLDAIFTTDGDSDRPLIADHRGIWLRGDVLGILAARFLKARGVAVPVSCNTALEKMGGHGVVRRTRIGSPYVVEAMAEAVERGQTPSVGYEANGGFLLASDILDQGRNLEALPTRDSVLPMICALVDASKNGCSLDAYAKKLPQRFTESNRLVEIPPEISRARLASLKENLKNELASLGISQRCGEVVSLDETDGIRITFSNNNIVHLRPSGNAPELRIYVETAQLKSSQKLLEHMLQVLATWRTR